MMAKCIAQRSSFYANPLAILGMPLKIPRYQSPDPSSNIV